MLDFFNTKNIESL